MNGAGLQLQLLNAWGFHPLHSHATQNSEALLKGRSFLERRGTLKGVGCRDWKKIPWTRWD